ncbi:MAG TPA: efflux RND transporter periplasmic adaptor subunit [Candidatus Sulfotelmatobacter sp.]|nr:efflux RND transporter periplasmic adaptor subunit [Candidatus Sulfotelmatobacter sp.]
MKRVCAMKATALAVTMFAACAATVFLESGCSREDDSAPTAAADSTSNTSGPPEIQLTDGQLNAIKIGTVNTYAFPIEKTGIGGIDFQNNLYSDSTLSTPVPSPVSGTIFQMLVELGDPVKKGQPLYTVQFGATNVTVRSPISGQVSAVNAASGVPVQPDAPPAPCAVADVSIKWLLANVPESDIPLYHPGQPVSATVVAFPGQIFKGKVDKIYPDVDSNTRRVTVRCELADKGNVLRTGMLADYIVTLQKPVSSLAVPANGIVREGDGTMTAWVTTDRTHFTQRVVKIGLREQGMVQILDGVHAGELVVTDGAIFLDNMLQAPADD